MKKGAIIMLIITGVFICTLIGLFIGRRTTDGQILVHAREVMKAETIDDETVAPFKAININTATVDELQELPGIGETTAEEIINYREKHGPFKYKRDLMNVKGIGEKTYNDIKSLITVQED